MPIYDETFKPTATLEMEPVVKHETIALSCKGCSNLVFLNSERTGTWNCSHCLTANTIPMNNEGDA